LVCIKKRKVKLNFDAKYNFNKATNSLTETTNVTRAHAFSINRSFARIL